MREETRKKRITRATLIEALANHQIPWPLRSNYHLLVGLNAHQQLYGMFGINGLAEIEAEALALRRQQYSRHSAAVDQSLLARCTAGDVSAMRLFYQQFEALDSKREVKVTHELVPQVKTILDNLFGEATDESTSDASESTDVANDSDSEERS